VRILHVTHQYRPSPGGAEKYITDLSEVLAARGHTVDVFTSRSVDYRSWRNVLPRHERLSGVDVYRFDAMVRTPFVWRLLDYGTRNYQVTHARLFEPFILVGNGPVCPGLYGRLLHWAARYDVVHINNLHYAHAALAYAAAKSRNLPVLITPHVHTEQPETYNIEYLRRMLRGVEAVFADTRAEKAHLLARGLARHVVVGGVGLRLEEFPAMDKGAARQELGLPEEAFVILFLGRKTVYKGLDVALNAFRQLRQQDEPVVFLAVGPETDYSQKLWAEYESVPDLHVRGHVTDEVRRAALAACDVLVLPSTGEAFGIVYLEAWAYRKPVIGARIPAVASLITHGEDGFLIERGEAGDLRRYLQLLLKNRELAGRMGQRGREKLEVSYTADIIGDVVEATYARVRRRHRSLMG
jgi:glycosyltransferase involved in cell wall biosynthesis